MASFTFPQHLMHKQLEPQWFPRSKEETESKLNALEVAEEAYQARLQKIIDGTPAAAIGLNLNKAGTHQRGGGGSGVGSSSRRGHHGGSSSGAGGGGGGGAGGVRRRRAVSASSQSSMDFGGTGSGAVGGTGGVAFGGDDESTPTSSMVYGGANATDSASPRFFWNRQRTSTSSGVSGL